MKDAKGHGSEKRRGDTKKVAPHQPAHLRPYSFKKKRNQPGGGGGGSPGSGGSSGGGSGGGGSQKHKTGAHTKGIHKAVTGKTLAQLSAAGTNPNIPPPQIGGRK
jgi:hypothetical protein